MAGDPTPEAPSVAPVLLGNGCWIEQGVIQQQSDGFALGPEGFNSSGPGLWNRSNDDERSQCIELLWAWTPYGIKLDPRCLLQPL